MNLIKQLEQATEGSAELSAEVFKYFNPDKSHWNVRWPGQLIGCDEERKAKLLPPYTTSVDAALSLVPKECRLSMYVNQASVQVICFGSGTYKDTSGSHKSSLPICICLAVLRAKEAEG